MKYVVFRTKDGTVWQTTGLEAFKQSPRFQRQGHHKMFIVAEASSWEEARALMTKMREEDYDRYLKRKRIVRTALWVVGALSLFVALAWWYEIIVFLRGLV